MTKHRITDVDVSTLVAGRTPAGRPELEALAQSLSEFRAASLESAPRPSAALAARLDFGNSSSISDSRETAFDADTIETTLSARAGRTRKGLVRTVFTWIAGLSLGLKIALGTVVAAAAATGAGAAGVLPFGTQQAFDEVVSVVLPIADDSEDGTDDGLDDGTDDGSVDEADADSGDDSGDDSGYDPAEGNFGSWVSEQAHDKSGSGNDFGKTVSEEAHNKPHPHETNTSEVEEGDDDVSSDVGTSNEGKSNQGKSSSGKGGH
jgi:hypothetical protein